MSMRKKKKTVLFLNIEELLEESFEHFVDDGLFNPDNYFILAHVFSPEIGEHLPPGVDKKDPDAINSFILEKLNSVASKIWDDPNPQWVEAEILYHQEPKLRAVNYLREVEADACVVATRGNQGVSNLFQESFAYYLVANAPCDVLILRPSKKDEEFVSAS